MYVDRSWLLLHNTHALLPHFQSVHGLLYPLVAAGIHVELSRLLLDKWRWLIGTWSRRYIGAQKLDALMRDWAGVEEEEEAMAAAEAEALAAAAGMASEADEKEPRVLQVG
jgi:hypothetical protein